MFNYFDPIMVCGNKVTDKLFQLYISLNTITYLKHPPVEKKNSALTVFQSEDTTSFWKNTMQDSSSRVRNLKHPVMCTASSRAPGGARWMPISLLFCHTVPPVSRQSCHRYNLYTETDTSRCGTSVNTPRTCMIDAQMLLPACLCEPHECGTSVHSTDTFTVLGRSLTQKMLHRASSRVAEKMTMISFSYPLTSWSLHLSRWL